MLLFHENALYTNFLVFNNEGQRTISLENLYTAFFETLEFQKNQLLREINSNKNTYVQKYLALHIEEEMYKIYNAKKKYLTDLIDFSKLDEFDPKFNFYPSLFECSLEATQSAYKKALDFEAGKVREKAVSEGSYLEQEYLLAYEEANSWINNGSIEEEIPNSIVVWAQASNLTNEEAALNVINTKKQFDNILMIIRNIRLLGKAAIDQANTLEEIEISYKNFINQLTNIAEQV